MARRDRLPGHARCRGRDRARGRTRRKRLSQDARAQMMLFAAIVLMLSLIALAGAVSRVSTLAAETARAHDDPFALEVTAVADGVERAIAGLEGIGLGGDELHDNLTAAMDHLATMASMRGYVLQPAGGSGPWISCPGGPDGYVHFRMTNGVTTVVLRSGVVPGVC